MRKAKLDILENIPDLDISARKIPEVDLGQKEKSSPRWALNKLLLIGLPALVALAVVVAVAVHMLSPAARPKQESIAQDTAAPAVADELSGTAPVSGVIARQDDFLDSSRDNIIHVREFIIELQDASGKGRVLLCDVALDLEQGSDVRSLGSITDIRKVIYWTVQNRNAVALRSVAERKKLKEDLTRELQKLPQGKFIRNVYFTNYLIL